MGHDLANDFIHGRDECTVLVTRMRMVLVVLAPFVRSLQWVVRPIDRPVHEERLLRVFVYERCALAHHEISEITAVFPNLDAVSPQIVQVRRDPVEEVGIVVDAPAHVAVGEVETLSVGHCLGSVPKMPFADVGRGISSVLEDFRHDYFLCRQSCLSLVGGHVSGHARTLWKSSRKQTCARCGAYGRWGIHLSEANSRCRQFVQCRGGKVLRAVAVDVDGPLVVRVNDYDVRFVLSRKAEKTTNGKHCREDYKAHFLNSRVACFAISQGNRAT